MFFVRRQSSKERQNGVVFRNSEPIVWLPGVDTGYM
jgi:hypothetical protein